MHPDKKIARERAAPPQFRNRPFSGFFPPDFTYFFVGRRGEGGGKTCFVAPARLASQGDTGEAREREKGEEEEYGLTLGCVRICIVAI